MTISTSNEKSGGDDKVEEETENLNKQKSKYHPFDDQLQHKFYKVLPDHSSIIILKD
jgi:hypothetical protein